MARHAGSLTPTPRDARGPDSRFGSRVDGALVALPLGADHVDDLTPSAMAQFRGIIRFQSAFFLLEPRAA